MTVFRLAEDQMRVDMTAEQRREAIKAAYWLTASSHEWVWSQPQQQAMARYVLWAHQRLSGIAQLTRDDAI